MIKRKGLSCILLIDDDDATNFIHKKILQNAGFQDHIQVCNSGQKALDYLTSQGDFSDAVKFPQPGIIFLDINMPAMNGWEFLEYYNELQPNQKGHIVVAMLTTSLNPDDRKKSESDKNVKHFITKPLKEVVLIDVIDQHFPHELD